MENNKERKNKQSLIKYWFLLETLAQGVDLFLPLCTICRKGFGENKLPCLISYE